ncbi:glycoside hydrolase family 128 protein [Xylariaceae sp. AK1471]|nr:glycoside hydrolase family 128 protein [Xylariaceae sp. AK1471]
MRPLEFFLVGNLLACSAIAATTTTKITSTTSKKVTSTSTKKASTTSHVISTSKKTTPSKSSAKSTTTSKKSTTTKRSTTTPKTTTTTKPSTKSTTTSRVSTAGKSSTTSKASSTTLKTTATPKSSTKTTALSTTTQVSTSTSKLTPSSTSTFSKPSTSSSFTTTTTTTTTTTITTASTSSSSSSFVLAPTKTLGSRGLSYNNPALTQPFSLSGQNSKVSWAYNWASDPYFAGPWTPDSYNPALNFVPMLWSAHPDLTSIWTANVNHSIASYNIDSVLAFNEPDSCGCWSCGSSCMDVPSAVSAYKQWVQPFAGRLRLGAPAVTNGVGDNVGLNYLQSFMGNCTGCRVDFIPLHYYGSVHDPANFKKHVESAWEMFNKSIPIWITEFGTDGGTEAEVLAWLRDVLPWLDSQSYVERYAYFMARDAGPPFLLHENATLTSIGGLYNSG